MSLSKYYENSTSFQPEDLVKREVQTPSGWQSQQLPVVADSKDLAARHPPIIPQVIPAESTGPADISSTPAQTTVQQDNQPEVAPQLPPRQELDVTNYLERAVAEEKIDQAYQRGIKAEKDKIDQDFQAATRALLSTCQQLDTIRETIISNSSEELQQFALAIAERILRISVREQDSTIIATIEEALQRAVKSDEFTLYIHPDDYATVAGNSTEIVAGLTGLSKIVIKKDKSVERGGAKIESDNCTIDATIASQFEVIREEIKKNL
ncbi:FliH/SctL family protein [Desulfocastanea catecholica]